MSDTPDLAGRTIIVTGAAGLLGREYGRALVDAGAHVVLADIAEDAVRRAAESLRGGPGCAVAVGADVTDEASVANLVRVTLDRFGQINGLVNNAALDPKMDRDRAPGLGLTFEQYPLEMWNRSLAVNLTGMFLCARAVAPALLGQRRGTIVNVSSTYGLVGPDQRLYESDDHQRPRDYKPVDYAVTKSAVLGFTRYLATY